MVLLPSGLLFGYPTRDFPPRAKPLPRRRLRGLTGQPQRQVQRALLPEPARVGSDNGEMLRGIAAVRTVMQENPERVWKAREVHDVLEQRGWISPGAQHPMRGTEAAINRLIKRGELDRIRPGRYRVTAAMKRSVEED